MEPKIIMVTSCKGGVGKSTVCSSLALSLARDGHRTLLVDCDFGNRSLDLFLGVQNRIVYDLYDLIANGASPESVVVSDVFSADLHFCSAPYDLDETLITKSAYANAINRLIDYVQPEFVLIDTPGNIGHAFYLAASVANEAYVVSSCQPVAIRAAGKTGAILRDCGILSPRLIINTFHPSHFENTRDASPLAIIDQTCLQLLAIIPMDEGVMKMQAQGKTLLDLKRSDVPAAISNLTERVLGNSVVLFAGFKRNRKKKLMQYL